MSAIEATSPPKQKKAEEIVGPWTKRRESARKARRPFEGQWMTNQAFAAGNQHVEFMPREHRVIDMRPILRARGRSDAKVDLLTQYIWTAIGKFAKDDFRPQLLFQHNDEEGENYAEGANKAFGWGWDEEWRGDEVLLDLLLTLVTFGSGALRCRYDRSKGPLLGEVPVAPDTGHSYQDPQTGEQHQTKPGQPILHLPAARAYVGEAKYYGEDIQMTTPHEGAVVWELLSPWNLLPPPAIEDARNFPWHLIVRPVHLDELKTVYADKAAEVKADEIEAMNILGLRDIGHAWGQDAPAGISNAKLEDHALVYTGYEMPCPDYPRGATVVFTHDEHLLDFQPGLPYNVQPHGPRPGLSYFHYWKVKQRFWGRALIEPGIGPQRTFNKRTAQSDEIIDRALPKVYAQEGTLTPPEGLPLEIIEMKPGDPAPQIDVGTGPGPWMSTDREQQLDNLERALGLHAPSVGETAPPGTPYALMALQAEHDADKLDPIAKDFKLGVADISRDSLEAMGQWPDGKLLMISGEDERLETVTFQRSMIPSPFMVKPAKGGTIPRSQGAELQKINDLWTAARDAGAIAQNPVAWLQWYERSLNDGKAAELPAQSLVDQQRRQAALENIVMARELKVLPVAPSDDPQTHIEEHSYEMARLNEAGTAGDQQAAMAAQVIDVHRQMHLQQAQSNTMANAAAAAPLGPVSSPAGAVPQAPPAAA